MHSGVRVSISVLIAPTLTLFFIVTFLLLFLFVFALHVNILGSIDQFQDQMNPSCHWELTIDDGSPRRIVLCIL